jgi:hypothetical protein
MGASIYLIVHRVRGERDQQHKLIYFIPICIGFGQSVRLTVQRLKIQERRFTHEHTIYAWPSRTSHNRVSITHGVLPAVPMPNTATNLQNILEEHFTSLVIQHFRQFPLYVSPLRVLREIYIFHRSLVGDSAHSRLLLKALKLLVMVHVGADITLPEVTIDRGLELLVRATMNDFDLTQLPTSCFIRAQIGSAMDILGAQLMKEIPSTLELLLLGGNPDHWPAALPTLLVVLMVVESIQYHAAKWPYHESLDPPMLQELCRRIKRMDSKALRILAEFYVACFGARHILLHMSDQVPDMTLSSGRTFIGRIRSGVQQAAGAGYLSEKASERNWDGENMHFFFDRLVARFLLAIPWHSTPSSLPNNA